MCRNPFDIPRKELLTHIRRMRPNFMKAALSGIQLQEAGMSLAVIEMKQLAVYQHSVFIECSGVLL